MTRRTALGLGLLGAVLVTGSLNTGLLLDDYIHAGAVADTLRGEAEHPWWDLFVVVDNADPADFERRRSEGRLPWWSAPGVRVAFFRPLSALTHYLDHVLLRAAWLMHLHSILWYGVLCWLVAGLYRRIEPRSNLALIAGLIFVVDDVHAVPVGWVANRNALLAGVFCVGTLWAHDRWRSAGWRSGAWLAPLFLAGGLLSAELGVGALGFVMAYALALDTDRIRGRLVSLASYFLVVVGWRLLHVWLGYGSAHSGSYLDPTTAPLQFLAVLPERLGMLIALQFGLPVKLLLPLLGSPGGQLLINGVWLAVTGGVLAGATRLRRDRTLRFWGSAFVLSLVPLAAAVPGDRMLMLPSIAAAPLLARTLALLAESVTCVRERVRVGVAALAAVVHLPVAAVCLAISAGPPDHVLGDYGPPESFAPSIGEGPDVERMEVILLNPPDALHPVHIGVLRIARGLPLPRRVWVWGPTAGAVDWRLVDPRTVELFCATGFGDDIFSRNFRGPEPMRVSHRVALETHTVEVREVTEDGRPLRVQFRFPTPVAENPNLRFLYWDGLEYDRILPPAPGRSMRLPTPR